MRCQERLRAGGIHFVFSFAVVLLFWAVARFLFYPGVLSRLGLYDGFLILVLVDIILGPLLTTVVYDSQKKSLKFDLSIIVLLQLGALIYGISLVYSQKPCVMVLSHNGLTVHTVADCRDYKIEGPFQFRLGTVPMVSMDLPKNLEAVDAIQFVTEFMERKPLTARSDLYVQIRSLPEVQLNSYLTDREYLDSEECYILPVISEHANGDACVDIDALRVRKFLLD